MRYFLPVLCFAGLAQTPEVTVSKDAVSVHTVRSGAMPLRVGTRGTITSTSAPAMITAVVVAEAATLVRAGQPVVARIGRGEIRGKVATVSEGTVSIKLEGGLPSGTVVGTPVFTRIEYARIENTLFVERPLSARENEDGALFRIDPGANFATRVRVRYGRAAADLIEIREGLKPGDHVIVSQTGAWSEQPRVRLQ